MLTAIVGILLGNLLIATIFAPALQELRKILGKFEAIRLPYRPIFGGEKLPAEERAAAKDAAAADFNRYFREYAMSFNAFKKVAAVFLIAILILALSAIWQLSKTVESRMFGTMVFVLATIAAGRFLQRALAPTPAELVSIDFLQNNFASLHLSSLFDAARVRIDPGRELHETVMHFNISQNLMFSGYRFLSAVSNRECSQVFFVTYGWIDPATTFQQTWTPELQYFSTQLGDFSLTDAMRVSPLLSLHSWLFVPPARGWISPKKINPRFLTQDVTDDACDRVGIVITPTNFAWESIDENVEFEREPRSLFASWRITRLKVPAPDSPQRILQMYKGRLERCHGIKCYDFPDGVNVRD
jgi:hypothetical protein